MFAQISGSIYAISAAPLRIDRRYVYLKGQTVDVDSYGGLCKHLQWLALDKMVLAHLYHYQISGLKQRPRKPGQKEKKKREIPKIKARSDERKIGG